MTTIWVGEQGPELVDLPPGTCIVIPPKDEDADE